MTHHYQGHTGHGHHLHTSLAASHELPQVGALYLHSYHTYERGQNEQEGGGDG